MVQTGGTYKNVEYVGDFAVHGEDQHSLTRKAQASVILSCNTDYWNSAVLISDVPNVRIQKNAQLGEYSVDYQYITNQTTVNIYAVYGGDTILINTITVQGSGTSYTDRAHPISIPNYDSSYMYYVYENIRNVDTRAVEQGTLLRSYPLATYRIFRVKK